MKYRVLACYGTLRIGYADVYPCSTKEEAKTSCAILEAHGYFARFEEVPCASARLERN